MGAPVVPTRPRRRSAAGRSTLRRAAGHRSERRCTRGLELRRAIPSPVPPLRVVGVGAARGGVAAGGHVGLRGGVMNEITAPALRGGQAMPFLAALGVLGLLAYELGEPDATLGWPEPGGPARFSVSGMDSLDDLAASLAALASRMREADELLPGAGPDFPPRKRGKGTDPTRSVPFGTGREWAVAQQGTLADAPSWLRSVFATNDATSRQHRTPGRLLRHPIFDAGPGTVSMSTTLENARDSATEADAMLRSLTAGYRVPGTIGGYLDWRADRDGSQAGSAKDASTAFGDPVATWLGLMSIRLTALVADGDRAVCGMMPRASGRYLRKPLLWPVW